MTAGRRAGVLAAACATLGLLAPSPTSAPAAAGGAARLVGPAAAGSELAVPADSSPADSSAAPAGEWTFPAGEEFRYEVTFGRVRVGRARLAVEGIDTVSGTAAYRLAYELRGGIPFYKVDDRSVSWVATDPLRTLRFEQHLREGGYRRDRRYVFDPEASTYSVLDLRNPDGDGKDGGGGEFVPVEGHQEVPTKENAIDEIAYLYLTRSLPLRVGETYRSRRYFQEDGNPVILEVLRRETVRVPAGKFRTVVVRPVIQTEGAFSEGGKAEVYVTADDRRLIVKLETSMKVGRLNMYLKEYEAGREDGYIQASGEP